MAIKGFVQDINKLAGRSFFVRNYRIGLFLIFILAAITANKLWNNANKAENEFLKGLNLNLTFKVLEIKPTGNHGYGVIYGQVVKSNKSPVFNAIYHSQYPFCKIKNCKVLIVSDYYTMEKNDSVIIHSTLTKYWVYRKGKLLSENKLTNTTDRFLYSDLEKSKYLEFSTYQN